MKSSDKKLAYMRRRHRWQQEHLSVQEKMNRRIARREYMRLYRVRVKDAPDLFVAAKEYLAA